MSEQANQGVYDLLMNFSNYARHEDYLAYWLTELSRLHRTGLMELTERIGQPNCTGEQILLSGFRPTPRNVEAIKILAEDFDLHPELLFLHLSMSGLAIEGQL